MSEFLSRINSMPLDLTITSEIHVPYIRHWLGM